MNQANCPARYSEVQDRLSGGTNFRQFHAQARGMIRSFPDQHFFIVSYHVEQFRFINELFGYENGTKVLRGVAKVLRGVILERELCSHVYADRFCLLMNEKTPEQLTERLLRIFDLLKDTIEFYGIHYNMISRFGVFDCGQKRTLGIPQMINRAVIAEKLPTDISSTVSFYDESMSTAQMTEKNKEDRLLPALEKHEFEIYYQPKYQVGDRSIAGAEALVRWQTERNTLVLPDEFVPTFENSGTSPLLDAYVMENVCVDIRRWMDHGAKLLPIAVNLSRVSLQAEGLAEKYRKTADRHGVPPRLIELEITERAFSECSAEQRKTVEKLHTAGFAIAIDDFGAGCSSLCMLRDIPADTVKLDRIFLKDVQHTEKGRIVAASMIELARRLNLKVVAEGVESEEQMVFLCENRCDIAQGFHLSKPIPASEYQRLLQIKNHGGTQPDIKSG
ncbi:MAG TPA: bifunctional diguanylate cyclase/phosphodiesterase [Clostridia bacterium]|nr:bifunctional diguanylate cyclase/phosphodiesterase [Clostridia bacterium]